jgi:hypothetical protein
LGVFVGGGAGGVAAEKSLQLGAGADERGEIVTASVAVARVQAGFGGGVFGGWTHAMMQADTKRGRARLHVNAEALAK